MGSDEKRDDAVLAFVKRIGYTTYAESIAESLRHAIQSESCGQLSRRQAEWVRLSCDAEVPTEAEQERRAEMARPVPPEQYEPHAFVACMAHPNNVFCGQKGLCNKCGNPRSEHAVDTAPTDLDAVEAALGPEPEKVVGKVVDRGWASGPYADLEPTQHASHWRYFVIVECAPPEESQPIDSADQARADRNIAACARVVEEG